MNFRFTIPNSTEVRANIQAMRLLEQAVEGFGSITSVEKCLIQSDQGSGFFTFIKYATKLRGCFFCTISEQEDKTMLTLLLLAGYDLGEWREELRKFLYKTAKELDCDEFYYMGRSGFSRLFPELEECARVYRKILKAPD